MRYDVRNNKGRFAKVETINWSQEKQAMTIDNESGETVELRQDVPAVLPLTGEEGVIRANMGKVADYIVQLSGWAKKFEEAEQKMNSLTAALDDAMRRVEAAEAQTKTAFEQRDSAVTNARMAKEAYVVVAKERDQANERAGNLAQDLGIAQVELDHVKGDLVAARSAHDSTVQLLEVAREERDRFREAEGLLRAEIDDAQRDHAEQLASIQATVDALRKENDGLHHKCNGLEDALTQSRGFNDRLAAKLNAIKGALD